jgi:ribosomal protein L11 methyltransferase
MLKVATGCRLPCPDPGPLTVYLTLMIYSLWSPDGSLSGGWWMQNALAMPEDLFVYECRGAEAPQGEPCFDGFLGLWPEPPFYYLFADRQALSWVSQWLQSQNGWSLRRAFRLPYEQWQQTAAQSLVIGPFRVDSGPPSERPPPHLIPIHVHSGLVFGTGLHPTTQTCLLALAGFYQMRTAHSVVDLGTGTGILAIACARLGASQVIAVDCLPLAVREAKANVALSGLEQVVMPLAAAGLNALRTTSELLLMNLEYPCLCQVLQEGTWKRYPWVLLGGFLRSHWSELQRFIPAGASIRLREELQDWCAVLLQTRN